MSEKTLKGEVQRQSILDAASRLFIERGFSGTSMYNIADELGVTRTAVYYYFRKKESILAALTESVTRVAEQHALELAARTDRDPVEAFRDIVRQHASLILSHTIQFRVVERNEQHLPDDLQASALASRRALLQAFTDIIKRGMESGGFRLVDARIAAFATIGMCNWTAWWFQPTGRKSVDEVANSVADLAVHALRQEVTRRSRSADLGESLKQIQDELTFLSQRVQNDRV